MTEHQETQDEDPVDVSYDPDPEDYEKYADLALLKSYAFDIIVAETTIT